jgi:hypothetical protein
MARVHDHDHAGELRTRAQIGVDERLPLRAQRLRHAGIAIARQIDEPRGLAERIEIDRLRAPGGLADEGEALAAEERIDCARLADVGAPGEGDLGRAGRR